MLTIDAEVIFKKHFGFFLSNIYFLRKSQKMRLYKTSEHAIRAIIYIALEGSRFIPVAEISEKLQLPYKYAGRLMPKLARAGILEVHKGKAGGYRLAKKAEEISLSDIIDAVEGLENYTRCILGFPECSDENPCPIHEYWVPIKEKILHEFLPLTLKQVIDKKLFKL